MREPRIPLPLQPDMTAAGATAPLTISIVSHGHGAWLAQLLPELARTHGQLIAEVVVTHNLPSAGLDTQNWPFRLRQRYNAKPLGFGANHNRAFADVATPLFCVLNPDITLPDDAIWRHLVDACAVPDVGCAFPLLINPDGSQQDNMRAVPTPWALLRRRLLQQQDARMDWVSAAFWVLPSHVYARLNGFDEGYFMYCEDVDFCLRLQLCGQRLLQVPQARAVHAAQRSSLRGGQHLRWHLQSLWRLWTSPTLMRYLWRPGR